MRDDLSLRQWTSEARRHGILSRDIEWKKERYRQNVGDTRLCRVQYSIVVSSFFFIVVSCFFHRSIFRNFYWTLQWTQKSDATIDKPDHFSASEGAELAEKPRLDVEVLVPVLPYPNKLKFSSSNFNFAVYFWILRWTENVVWRSFVGGNSAQELQYIWKLTVFVIGSLSWHKIEWLDVILDSEKH